MQRILIDTDPGVDDALAILLALRSPELQIEALTTVCGNVPVTQGTENSVKNSRSSRSGRIPTHRSRRSADRSLNPS